MLFSENIYFLVLFTFPAALNIIFNTHIRKVPVSKPDKSVELAECIVFCFAVFMCNIIFLHNDMKLFAQYALLEGNQVNIFCENTGFDYIGFMMHYFIINVRSSILVITSWYTVGQWIFRKISNCINVIMNRPKELKFSDVWSNVFETNNYINTEDFLIRIEKGGTLVTAGVVMIYTPPHMDKKEFLLKDVDLVKQIFEDDEKTPIDCKMFKTSDYEYYDVQNDMLIKFYNTELYRKVYGDDKVEE